MTHLEENTPPFMIQSQEYENIIFERLKNCYSFKGPNLYFKSLSNFGSKLFFFQLNHFYTQKFKIKLLLKNFNVSRYLETKEWYIVHSDLGTNANYN